MKKYWVSLLGGGALLAAFVPSALAQNATTAAPAPAPAPTPAPVPPPTLNSPQLRDFSLQPRQRIVTQPAPVQAQPPTVSAPPPSTQPRATQPNAGQPRPAPAQRPAADARRPAAPQPTAAQPVQAPPTAQPVPAPVPAPAPTDAAPQPEPAQPKAAPVPVNEVGGGFPWYYGIPLALLALLAVAWVRQRRRNRAIHEAAAIAAEEQAAKAVETARPEPQPRPWLELELKAERLASTNSECLVQFELEITNSGAAPARNLRIDVKMFNAGEQQDQEIGSFFKTAGRESTKCNLPGIRAGQTGAIRGEVAMSREEMRAVVLDNRYLFIPVIAVNALYDYGDGRTGQTSKSYVVGRELEQAGQKSEKMGAFRVDQGPRIWRTVGQRQHKLARRV